MEERCLLTNLMVPLAKLGLSRRTYNAIYRANIWTIGDLISYLPEKILQVRGIGETSLAEIETQLKIYLVENPDIIQQVASQIVPKSTFTEPVVAPPQRTLLFVEDTASLTVLDLSVRSYNALIRAGINAIDRLVNMSDEEIGQINNVGVKAIKEIREKLEEYLINNPQPLQLERVEEERSIPIVPLELLEHLGELPLDNISIERLGLSPIIDAGLKRQGIFFIQQLIHQVDDLDDEGQIGEPLKCYLTWLIKQDAEIWFQEVAGEGISPVHQMALANSDLELLIQQLLEPFDERQQKIIRWRFGLDDDVLTLEQIGRELGLTRERVRQIEKKITHKLPQFSQKLRPFVAFIHQYLKQSGGVATAIQLADELTKAINPGSINPLGVCSLLLPSYAEFTEIKPYKAWGLSSLFLEVIPEIHEHAIKILADEYAPLEGYDLLTRLKATSWYEAYAGDEDGERDAFILACLNLSEKVVYKDGFYRLERWGRQLVDNIVMALREIGKPAHYSEITKVVNASLSPEQQTTPRLVHAQLGRYTNLFVWVRLRGTYGLKEWGLEETISYVDTAAYILEAAGHPLTLEQILERIPEVRPYFDHSSVIITLGTHPRFRSFPGNSYGLVEQINLANESSFDDLFSSQLAQWQAEFDNVQTKNTFDTQNEVDTIRAIGLDFFKE